VPGSFLLLGLRVPMSDDFGECNFTTAIDRMQHIATTKDEACLNLDIYNIESENSFKTSINLKDFKKIIRELQDRTVIED
jgi:hypothetical protein